MRRLPSAGQAIGGARHQAVVIHAVADNANDHLIQAWEGHTPSLSTLALLPLLLQLLFRTLVIAIAVAVVRFGIIIAIGRSLDRSGRMLRLLFILAPFDPR